MENTSSVADSMRRLKVCVIIPTYNNSRTLQRVIDSVLKYTSDIIIVNDGATDATAEILKTYPQLAQICHAKNSGKGIALQNGFRKARELGFDHAITIDSDGQHFASDIPQFIASLENEDEVLLIGSRNMAQEGVPKKSSFGNKFSNFWFWFETGIRLEDTQSGYRLYPLRKIPKKYNTSKFEFEIEIIVRSAWRGIPVKNIPIRVLYDPDERISHFRPFQDFTRISILNTVLVVIALFYIKPRDFFRKLKKKGLKKFLLENIIESDGSNAKKSLSVALGVFIGISPFWGFQTILVLFLAVLFRLNKVISFAFSNISIPPMVPFIVFASLKIGSHFIHAAKPLVWSSSVTFSDIQQNITQYIVGSFILATLTALLFGLSAYLILTFFSTFKNKP
jgi:glycosyltransferase involved in cell wall biosynthesis